MKRRLFLAAAAWPLVARAGADTPHWRARFLDGGFDGSDYWSGLAIDLDAGWKTYWRVPGDGGIPPQIDVTGANLKSAEVLFPLPSRFSDESGNSIGYKEQVIFPVKLVPVDVATPLEVSLAAFFGVCEDICIPARSAATLRFSMSASAAGDAVVLAQWRDRVPVPAPDGPVRSAVAVTAAGKPALRLELSAVVDDIFASGADTYYFHAPMLEAASATLAVSGARSVDELKGKAVRIVSVMRGKGLEQELVVR